MGNETSVPDGGATTQEELARAADALSGTSPPPAVATASAGGAAAATAVGPAATATDRGGTSSGGGGGGAGGSAGGSASAGAAAGAAAAPPPRTPNAYAAGGTAPLGGAEAIGSGGPTPPGSQQLEKAKAMQQQMKAKAAAMKAKGMTSAKSMFQRTGIGSASASASASQGESSASAVPATPSAAHPLHQQQQYHHHQQQDHHGRTPSNLLPGQGGKGAVVDVMYATENHAHAHAHVHAHQQHGHQQQYQQQHGMPSAAAAISAEGTAMTMNSASAATAAATGGSTPASAAADALRRQMQDMTLSGGQGGGMAPPATAASAAGTYVPGGGKTTGLGPTGDEKDWQAAWEEDDESSGDEEEDYDTADEGGSRQGSFSGPAVGPSAAAASSAAMLGPPFRVSMDGGHSSISPANHVATGMHPNLAAQQQHNAAAMGSHVAPPPAQQQQQQQFIAPTKPGLPPGPMDPGASTTPDVPFDGANAAAVAAQQQQVQQYGGAMVGGPLLDGVIWETQALGGDSAIKTAGSTDSMDDRPSEKMFTSMRVLGKGSFGKVVLVQKRTGKERGGLFAMKILRKTHLVKRRQIERTKTERKVLALVDHPFIMKLHFAFQSEDKLYLVLDYCPGGELFFHLSRYRRFPERVARFFSAELLLALGHLHKKGIIYRDLKPENVLLDADGHVKLGDFGLAKDRISHPCQGATSMCGTPEYMAPEVLAQAGHGFCVDYWGLGMLTYEMMTGLPPWYTTDRSKLFRRLKSAPLDIPTFFSMESASCVSQLLERNPRKRLGVFGIKSAMQHEFFREIDWRSLRDRRINSPIRPCESWKANQQNQQISNNAGTANPASISHHASASGQGQTTHLSQNDLDVATANFDQTFTRMALETVDNGGAAEGEAAPDDGKAEEELNADTFVGFTFHENESGRTRNRDGVGRIRGSGHPNQQIIQQQPPPSSSQKYNSHGPRR